MLVDDEEPQGHLQRGMVNPRLSDLFNLVIRQDKVPFAIPHLREDLNFCIDPFLLWQSDSARYQELHKQLVDFIDHICKEAAAGRVAKATQLLLGVRELPAIGLGYSAGSKEGSALGKITAARIADVVRSIPQLIDSGFTHIEIVALLVPKVADDRISDMTISVLLEWFAEFTTEQCKDHDIPTRTTALDSAWDHERQMWRPLRVQLPWNPINEMPVVLAPLNLLRHLPWINYGDYYKSAYAPLVLPPSKRDRIVAKDAVLAYNRANYQTVETYVADKEAASAGCSPHPLFKPLALETLKRKLAQLRALPSGKGGGADKKFEDLAYDLLSSMLYPELDLADSQVRTMDGVHIRDVIFHNDSKTDFLRDIRDRHLARQIVFELKNVDALTPGYVNQLYRYLDEEEMGRVGILLGRNPAPGNVVRNTVNLHSSRRFFILCMDDRDLELMIQMAQSGYRPVEVIRKRYIEFSRQLPK